MEKNSPRSKSLGPLCEGMKLNDDEGVEKMRWRCAFDFVFLPLSGSFELEEQEEGGRIDSDE